MVQLPNQEPEVAGANEYITTNGSTFVSSYWDYYSSIKCCEYLWYKSNSLTLESVHNKRLYIRTGVRRNSHRHLRFLHRIRPLSIGALHGCLNSWS